MSEKNYFLKRPIGKRRSFSLVCYTEKAGQPKVYHPFKDERIIAINKQFKAGKIDFETAEMMCEEIKVSLLAKSKNVSAIFKNQRLSIENEKLLSEFWADRYAEKFLADERSAKNDFIRALKLLGTASLHISPAKDITAQLKKNCWSANQHRRAADRLNEILRYLKRDIKLGKPGEDFVAVKYLNEAEVFKLAEQAPTQELKWLTLATFGTGTRLGEALAIGINTLSGGIIFVHKQLLPNGKLAPPKRNKTGRAPCIKSCYDSALKWAKVSNKGAYRDLFYDFVSSASRKLWSDDKSKHICIHDLRHSYAIHCLSKGHNLKLVANSLRNTSAICEKYYTGFCHTDETLETALRML